MFQSTSTSSPFRSQQQQQPLQNNSNFTQQPSNSFQPQFGYGNQYQQQQPQQQLQFGMGGLGSSGGMASGSPGFMMGGMMLGGGDQAGGNGTPQVAKRNYLPGYLSGGIGASGGMGSSSDQNQSQNSSSYDDRAMNNSWDSSSASNGRGGAPSSPEARFNQSLFGSTSPGIGRESSTPSKAPRLAYRGGRPTAEVEEDAPPTESLSYFSTSPPTNSFASSTSSPNQSIQQLASSTPNIMSTPPPTTNKAASKTYSVRVYGFPSSALPHLISHFSSFGAILSSTPSPTGGNWVTIAYAKPWEALRASRQDGIVLGEVLMIGVKLVDEEAVRTAIVGGDGEIDRVGTPASVGNGATGGSALGKKVQILGPGSAFKQVPGSPKKWVWGGGDSQQAQRASLFAEKNRAAVSAASAEKGVLGKVADYVFGF